jgi:hypothetical protein
MEAFYQQFHILHTTEDAKNGKGIKHLVQVLSERLSLSEAEWQIGRSKIFLRLELASKLQVLAKLQRLATACVMGKFGPKITPSQAGRLLAARIRTAMILPNQLIGSGSHLISAILRICRFVVAALAIRPDKKDKSYVCPSHDAWFTPSSFPIL